MDPVVVENAVAVWFNNIFGSFDFNILNFYNTLHESVFGGILDIFFLIYTHLGDDGILFILLGLILLLFKKTRKVGAGMLGGVIIGALITNVTLKPFVERPRPFELYEYLNDPNALLFKEWWEGMGSVEASSMRSFPSGHTTSAVAALFPVFLYCDKKKSWLALVAAVLMGASRNYVMVHYPSDVLGGIIVGAIAGILAFLIVNYVYEKLSENDKIGKKIVSFDLAEVIKSRKKA